MDNDAITLINQNSGAISATATVLSVIIAAVYTFYTTRLWRVSLEQVRNANQQAETAKRQLQLIEQQMALTEKAFEQVNRPQLQIDAHIERYRLPSNAEQERSMLTVVAKNYGVTAATVMSADCSVPKGEGSVWGHRMLPIVIPPHETEVIGRATLSPVPLLGSLQNGDDVADYMNKRTRWFHVHLRYRGLNGIDYTANQQISLVPDLHDSTVWAVLGSTPTDSEFWELHRKVKSGDAA